MKIAYLAPEFLPVWGGVGAYSIELVKELSKKKNMEIHVFTPCRDNYPMEKILKYFKGKIKIHYIGTANDTFFYNLKFQLALLKEFPRINKKEKFDLVYSANLVHMPDIFLQMFDKVKVPTICTVHTTLDSQSRLEGKKHTGSAVLKGERVEILSRLASPYIKLMQKIYLSKVNNFIAVSEFVADQLPEDKNVTVIRNGVDFAKFKKKSARFDYIDSIDKKKVLFAGRLLYMKGLETLIESIKEILNEEDVYFIFAGRGDIRKWKKYLKDVPEENYAFLGYVPYENMHELYSKADVFVLPSLAESCPLTILEAMAAGVPVVASNVGGIPEIVKKGKGCLVEPGDSEELAGALLNLLHSRTDRKKISENALKTLKRKHTVRIMANATAKTIAASMEA